MKKYFILFLSLFIAHLSLASIPTTYLKPPAEIQQILDAKLPPIGALSPTFEYILFSDRMIYPPLSILSEPMLKLGGLRINTLTNGESSYPSFLTSFSIKKIPDGAITPINLNIKNPRFGAPHWNATGTRFVFTNTTAQGIELWSYEVKSKKAKILKGFKINPLLSSEISWLADHENLLIKAIPSSRQQAPVAKETQIAPHVEESTGVATASSTYEVKDVLNTPHDADLFDYYTRSQLLIVSAKTNKIKKLGSPAIYANVDVAPNGKLILVEQITRPYSYKRTYARFPKKTQIWDFNGNVVENLPDTPLAENVPIHGEATGPRDYSWISTKDATLLWLEALDQGNPRVKVPHRDRVMSKNIGEEAHELFRTEERVEGLQYIEGDQAFVYEFNQDKHWQRIFLVNLKDPQPTLKTVFSFSQDDAYGNPGGPLLKIFNNEVAMVKRYGDSIYFSGQGSSPSGDRPFLDRLNLVTLKKERLFRSDENHYERHIALLDEAQGTFLTRRESPTEPPNIFLRKLSDTVKENTPADEANRDSSFKAITEFTDPTPQLRGITKQIVNYQRADGLKLSFTLYLPPDYKPGQALPTVFYAYPLDYAEQSVAGQVKGTTKNFSTFLGTTHLFFLLRGYAVLDNVAMPIVGPTDKIYDTYLEQLVMDAQAAIKKAVEMGVTDPQRVGVLGHSHGALMTANLLAHSDLFRAGIARSGAYNKTLTMFGFQNEKRSLFEARETYFKVSPTLYAEKIKKPILLIHGENDSNPGTTPMQSKFFYEAIRGTGGTVRLVMLPYENHGYLARETTEHVLYEMINWFDTYVKNVK